MEPNMAKHWTSELVIICHEDGQKVGMVYQNGSVEIYTLKPANKQDVIELLEVEVSK